jgi:hypothetical protein
MMLPRRALSALSGVRCPAIMLGREEEHHDGAGRSTLDADEFVDRIGVRRGPLNSTATVIYTPSWMWVMEGVVS